MGNDQKRAHETAEQRKERLAAELRANLHKRKAQARARTREGQPEEPGDSAARLCEE